MRPRRLRFVPGSCPALALADLGRLRGAPARRRPRPATAADRRRRSREDTFIVGKRTQDIRNAEPELKKGAAGRRAPGSPPRTRSPSRATPTSRRSAGSSIHQIKHAMDLYQAANDRLPQRLRRVHERDHQGQQHRPAATPVLPEVRLRREGAQAHHPRIPRPQEPGRRAETGESRNRYPQMGEGRRCERQAEVRTPAAVHSSSPSDPSCSSSASPSATSADGLQRRRRPTAGRSGRRGGRPG